MSFRGRPADVGRSRSARERGARQGCAFASSRRSDTGAPGRLRPHAEGARPTNLRTSDPSAIASNRAPGTATTQGTVTKRRKHRNPATKNAAGMADRVLSFLEESAQAFQGRSPKSSLMRVGRPIRSRIVKKGFGSSSSTFFMVPASHSPPAISMAAATGGTPAV